MPVSRRTHLVEVHTVGPATLDELADLVDEARRELIPGQTPALVGADVNGNAVVRLVHDLVQALGPPQPVPPRPYVFRPGDDSTWLAGWDDETTEVPTVPVIGP